MILTMDVDTSVSRRAPALIFWLMSDSTITWQVISKVKEIRQIALMTVEGKGIDTALTVVWTLGNWRNWRNSLCIRINW